MEKSETSHLFVVDIHQSPQFINGVKTNNGG